MDYLFAPDRFDAPDFTIRSYQPGDGALLQTAVTASYEHLRTFMPWAKPDVSVEDEEKLCRMFRGKYLLAQDFALGIFSPSGDRLLGGTGFHLCGPLDESVAEIGMWIHVDQAGHGLGTKALLAVLEWGFTAWPWQRLFWRCDTRNLASARVAQKAGLTLEGCMRSDALVEGGRRDTYFYAILRDEWLARQQVTLIASHKQLLKGHEGSIIY